MRHDVKDPSSEIKQEGDDLSCLLARNREWASSKTKDDPNFFSRLVGQQHPRYFWIGCSDSRVPATEIVDLDPGEMFVHRNIANLAVADDPNFAAALLFAVDVLQVQHVLVVGHYGCGGIQAAMAPETHDAVGEWLAPVRSLDHDPADAHQLCERNIIAQVSALARNPIVCGAWKRGARLTLHGWVYAIGDGLLRTICGPITNPL
ncbi:carbonic anhydrase [Sphingobium indicum]|uniref:carbonic anhydrase n=1 Tax=Sphingobium indicum (strain DSM 16412 / CCM 7286 / MTCC 6364 / B90A) TaxID=861109 RepID=A0A1L5BKB0_SPHIB|nr:carbonic anhydrase [Sphingobium indicum]APL93331.1 carbonic anhydrase [Sphingobium indicum B90A]